MFQKNVVVKITTHTLYSVTFFDNGANYEITWKNIAEPGRPQMTIWRMRFTIRTTNAKDTHSEYVILIALPRQQFLKERASLLRLDAHRLSCSY
jgi:hypothetical protein